MALGRVASWRDEQGWGTFWSPELPSQVWAHFSMVLMDGYRSLVRGEYVAFGYEEARQDSYVYRATWVRRLSAADQERVAAWVAAMQGWRQTGGDEPERPRGLEDEPPDLP